MDAPTVITQAKDIITVRRVFGEPIERDGMTIVPVAAVLGGLSGTTDNTQQPAPTQRGRPGSGLLLGARPLGVYVIGDGRVRWRPALDWNRAMGRSPASPWPSRSPPEKVRGAGGVGGQAGGWPSPVITSVVSPNPHLSWRRSILAGGRQPGRHK